MSQKLLPWKITLPNPGVATGGMVMVGDLDLSQCTRKIEIRIMTGKPVKLIITLIPGTLEVEGVADADHPLFIEQTAIGDTYHIRGVKPRITAEERKMLNQFIKDEMAKEMEPKKTGVDHER